MFTVSQPELLTGLFHQLGDGRVVDMADFGKQMMLDLKIQTAQQPCCHRATPGKVDGGLDLMYGPRVFDPSGVMSWQRKRRLLHAVCQLKYDAEHQTQHNRRSGVEQHDDPDGVKHHGDAESQGEKNQFAGDEDGQVPALGTREPMFSNSSGDDVSEITNKMPVNCHEPIQRPEIIVLPAIKPEPSAMRREPPQPAQLDIGVIPGDVDVGVMEDDVLEVPVMGTPAYYIYSHRHHPVDPIVVGVRLMAPVVLNIETDRCRK